jgi:GNAT superfamily N-acetyltransferase
MCDCWCPGTGRSSFIRDHPGSVGQMNDPGPSPEHRRNAARAALAQLLARAAAGEFPPADGRVEVLPQPSGRDAGVISLTGYAVIFADADPAWVTAQLPVGDLSGPLTASFLHVLSQRLRRYTGSVDMLTCADPLTGPPPTDLGLTELTNSAGAQHPRFLRALLHRDEVRAWQAPGAVLMLGRGVAGRFEVSVEVDPACRGRGLGTRLASAARHLVPDGAPLWAQIAPANAASVRAFLAAGFRPIGAEALLGRDPS